MATVSGMSAESMQEIANASVTSGAVDVNGNLVLTTKAGDPIQAGNVLGPITVGLVTMFAGASSPAGWLLCDGSTVSRTSYAKLFSLIGTTYGAGDGSTTFNLPNLKGRVPVGRDTTQAEFDTIGESGGEKTHKLSVAEMPAHTHTQNSHFHGITDPGHNHSQNNHGHGVSDPGHNHSQNSHSHGQDAHTHGPSSLSGFQLYTTTAATRNQFTRSTTATAAYVINSTDINALGYGSTDSQSPNIQSTTASNVSNTTGVGVNGTTASNNANFTGVSVGSTTATNNNTGGDGTHNNLQPYLVMNYIIKF